MSAENEKKAIENPLKHIAIIMDGNGRWAKERHKLRLFGHRAGIKSVRAVVENAGKIGLEALTLFAFSSENWQRPQEEVDGLFALFIYALDREAHRLDKNNVKLKIVGDVSSFPDKLQKKIKKTEQKTANNTGLILNIAANYGGRWDITQACRSLVKQALNQELNVNDIDEARLNQEMQLSHLAEVDLLIRTGGECRISNFLLWQIAYSELYFTPVLWPDFNQSEFQKAVEWFYTRTRRFGKL